MDCDWSRFTTVFDKKRCYYLFVARFIETEHHMNLYVFKWDDGVFKYQNRQIHIKNVPGDVYMSSFEVAADPDVSHFSFFITEEKEISIYCFTWSPYHSSDIALPDKVCPLISIENAHGLNVDNIDRKRWFVYYDPSLHICAFKKDELDSIVQFDVEGNKLRERHNAIVLCEHAEEVMARSSAVFDHEDDEYRIYQVMILDMYS